MKKTKAMPAARKVLAAAIAAIMSLTILLPAQMAFAADTQPYAVDGRTLTAAQAGDSSDWIEIARYNDNSLIVRKNFVNWNTNASCYGNPSYQYLPFGTTTAYNNSNVRKYINAWFNGTAAGAADKLASSARLRDYAVKNNALSAIGTCCNPNVSLSDGLSKPTDTLVNTGDDVAFALSYSETADFCSLLYFMRNLYIANQPSPAIATANYAKLNLAPGYMYGMWLRSPGDCANTAGSMCNSYSSVVPGRVFQFKISGSSSEYGMIHPALWVKSNIFITTATITVIHKDLDTNTVLSQEVLTVPAGAYGPYNSYPFAGYNYVGLDAGSAPASGTIGAGQAITITFGYSKAVQKATVIVIHRDMDTGATLWEDDLTVDAGAYSYNPYPFSGYMYIGLAPGSDPASGTIAGGETKTVIFTYTKFW